MSVLARLHHFAQPAQVTEPIELLRAGVVFHARGLLNTRAIQHNLDWVWPFWIERQFNPADPAFIPRAFSITHVNLTHRNWTAVGLPGCEAMPLVDPHGLVTPWFDGWSLDFWMIPLQGGEPLLPSRLPAVDQQLLLEPTLRVQTTAQHAGARLRSSVELEVIDGQPCCVTSLAASAEASALLAVSLRPANPEGVSFIHDIRVDQPGVSWLINQQQRVRFDRAWTRCVMSTYEQGDVYRGLQRRAPADAVRCKVGMATAAALYQLDPGQALQLCIEAPVSADDRGSWRHRESSSVDHASGRGPVHVTTWPQALEGCCQLRVPDPRMQFLFDAAVATLVLHSPSDVYPGPYTYKRFWFRDAALILNAMLTVGLHERAQRVIERFPQRQSRSGYFHSQEGEWDSNGQVLWLLRRYEQLTGNTLGAPLLASIRRGAKWIDEFRTPRDSGRLHAGLLPAGFSAEHLGPNDYYYWDDFWAVAGLQAAAQLLREQGDAPAADHLDEVAGQMLRDVGRSLEASSDRRGDQPGLPASPYRRLDAGAVGSIVASFPLQLYPPEQSELMQTVEFLLAHCSCRGGFFQDMIHSGINAYLTLHLAQVLLRAGDARWWNLVQAVAQLASPTGQWPEAIHPHTGGGCMGDGQHVWAAAEWLLMLRNMFVREEGEGLILASGIPSDWLHENAQLELGPTSTPWGPITVKVQRHSDTIEVSWYARWRRTAPSIEVRLRGTPTMRVDAGVNRVELPVHDLKEVGSS